MAPRYAVLVAVATVATLAVNLVVADIPVNCMYDDVVGHWMFQVGEGGHDRTLNCSSFGTGSSVPKHELKVSLYFPDLAIDQNGNEGFWTMVYNQGFEVVMAGRKYFAFSMYETQGNTTISKCDQILPGWSHDTFGRNWACYTGHKIDKISAKIHKTTLTRPRNVHYNSNTTIVGEINRLQRSWTAAKYRQFEGLTIEQMTRMAGGRKTGSIPKAAPVSAEHAREAATLPKEFDWRNVNGINYLSDVRKQGDCGSCYAFASLGMNEARWRIFSNNTITPVFSPQDVVECSQYSQGCDGGFPYLVGGKYAEDFGLVLEECNPYEGKDGVCSTDKSCQRIYSTNYEYIGGFFGACNEAVMRINLVKNGPFVVAFQVFGDFFSYKSGVYHHTGLEDKFNPFEPASHGVLVVGYGTDMSNPGAPENFWIMKNSWGTNWGENGYFRIRRGTDECSIEGLGSQAMPVM